MFLSNRVTIRCYGADAGKAVVTSRSMDILDFRQSPAGSAGASRAPLPDPARHPRPGVRLAVHPGSWPGGLPMTSQATDGQMGGDLGMRDRGPWSCATSAAVRKRPDG